MTFSMCVANFVVSLLWTIYGRLVHDKFILVSCFGVQVEGNTGLPLAVDSVQSPSVTE